MPIYWSEGLNIQLFVLFAGFNEYQTHKLKKVMKRIAAIALSAAIAGSTLAIGQTNVSFWMDLGGAGVSVSHSTGHRPPPPPPPRRVVHYVDYGWDAPVYYDYGYERHHSKKLHKKYKKYRKAQKKFYKELYKQSYRHHRHHHDWDDDDDD